MDKIVEQWNAYYRDPANAQTAIRDKAFFRLEVDAIVEAIQDALASRGLDRPSRILELGSGTGELVSIILNRLDGHGIEYVGVDISKVAIKMARGRELGNCTFVESDFLAFLRASQDRYDLIITQRSIMAVLDRSLQTQLLGEIKAHLEVGGTAIISEGTQDAFKRMAALRKSLSVEPYKDIWHCLYIEEEDLYGTFGQVGCRDFASLYWLVTRVIYPHFEEPKHNSTVHAFAEQLDQTGDYGLVKLFTASV